MKINKLGKSKNNLIDIIKINLKNHKLYLVIIIFIVLVIDMSENIQFVVSLM